METALENLSKDELLELVFDLSQERDYLKAQLAICKKHEVNPFQLLKYTLQNIMTINHKNIRQLYPQNYKSSIQNSNM